MKDELAESLKELSDADFNTVLSKINYVPLEGETREQIISKIIVPQSECGECQKKKTSRKRYRVSYTKIAR
jgi:hypothetical protein